MSQLALQFDSLREEVKAIGGLIPRDYQRQAIDEAFRLWTAGTVGVLVRAPTGSGKTITGTMLAERWNAQSKHHRTLVIAHERQLVYQFADEIHDVLGKYPGIEMASEKVTRGMPPIVVASRQTLIAGKNGDSRLHQFDAYKYKWLVVCDEVHRWAYKLKSCAPILQHFDGNPENRRLGLTATPMRGDGTSLAKVCPAVASDYRLYDIDGGVSAVNDGWAVPYDQRFVVAEGVDFKNLREIKSTGDFDPAELEAVLGQEEQLRKLVQPTLELVGDRRTIIFSATTAMAKAVALCINSFRPDSAVELDGQHGEWRRKEVYTQHQAGGFQFLSVCGLCREGYNDPGIQAVVVYRPTKSRTLAEQMKGRGCRPLRGCVDSKMSRDERLAAIAASTKPNCMVVDLVGITGMADCATTAHILASGEPDAVINRANENAAKNDGPPDMAGEIRKARKQIEDEERARRRAEREAREQAEREEAKRRGRIQSEVAYTATTVQQGTGIRVHHSKGRGARMLFGKHKGKLLADIPTGYLRSMTEGEWCKTEWLKNAAKREVAQRQSVVAPIHGRASIDEINLILSAR